MMIDDSVNNLKTIDFKKHLILNEYFREVASQVQFLSGCINAKQSRRIMFCVISGFKFFRTNKRQKVLFLCIYSKLYTQSCTRHIFTSA